MDNTNLIFVGFEVTEKMQEQFAACKDQDKAYLENPDYLEIVSIDEKRYVGKRAGGAIAIDRIEDTARSVVSLLARVCTEWTFGPDKALVLAAEEETQAPPEGASEPPAGFDYSGLVD